MTLRASDLAKAQSILADRTTTESTLMMLQSGEALVLMVGKTELKLTGSMQNELRQRIIDSLQKIIDDHTASLEELGVDG